MARILGILFVLGVVVLFLSSTHRTTVIAQIPVTQEVAAVVEAVEPASPEVAVVGTLVFYPNNVKPVPYLLYQDERGTTVSKALAFDALPATDFSVWAGARVSVVGTLVREHILVSRIDHISPP